jgi:hypothetical protein
MIGKPNNFKMFLKMSKRKLIMSRSHHRKLKIEQITSQKAKD